MDEPALIAQAKQGDVDAFNTLVLHYQDTAYTVAYRILGDPDSAADATQEAFIAAYRALSNFRGPLLSSLVKVPSKVAGGYASRKNGAE